MKILKLLIVSTLYFNTMNAQNNITVLEICRLFRAEFNNSNINSDYDNLQEFQTFNFINMNADEIDTLQNLSFKLYFSKDTLKKISVYDTTLLNRNWDFDIIYFSNELLILTIFIFDDKMHNEGNFFNGFLLNDRINNKNLLFNIDPEADLSLYFTGTVVDIKRSKIKNYDPEIVSNCENYIFSILELDNNLFPIKRLNWNFQILYSKSYYHYKIDKIIEELLIINQLNRRPYSSNPYKILISEHSLEDLYHLFKLGYDNTFSIIFQINHSNEFPKGKPIWANKKFYYYYIDRPEIDDIDLPETND